MCVCVCVCVVNFIKVSKLCDEIITTNMMINQIKGL